MYISNMENQIEKQVSPEIKEWIGGLDASLFEDGWLSNYIRRDGVHSSIDGYIGHRVREDWLDAMLCDMYLPIIEKKDFAVWLTSYDGKRVGNEIESKLSEGGRDAVREYLKVSLPRIYNYALIYNSTNHAGFFYGVTKELFEDFDKRGLMMGSCGLY